MQKTMECVMTPNVQTIEPGAMLKTAETRMKELGVRHLPVVSDGRVVGVLSDRDVKLAHRFYHAAEMPVEVVMSEDPYVVPVDAPFFEVMGTMAERKYGCVVITREGRPAGIFTAVDALRFLAEIYRC